MSSKAESSGNTSAFLLFLVAAFFFTMAAYPSHAYAKNCAQQVNQCEAKLSKLMDEKLKLGKEALKLVRERSRIRHEYAPVQSALSEIKTMRGFLSDSKTDLDAAAKSSGARVRYQRDGRAIGVIAGSGRSAGSANVEFDIYNKLFDKYRSKLKREKDLNKKARAFQKKLDKLDKAISQTDKRMASQEKKMLKLREKCRNTKKSCHAFVPKMEGVPVMETVSTPCDDMYDNVQILSQSLADARGTSSEARLRRKLDEAKKQLEHCESHQGRPSTKKMTKKAVAKKTSNVSPLKIGGCLFTQPKLTNYKKGLSGLPDDIPELPGATFGESYEHSSGKSFSMGSMKSPATLKSSYKKQLQNKGWKILKDDVLNTRLGAFHRLFAKTKKACISVVTAKAPAGMPHKSVLTIYTYPGSGKRYPGKNNARVVKTKRMPVKNTGRDRAITVRPGRKIQSAIDKAKNGSTIIVSPGTYTENIKISGKSLTLRSSKPTDKNVRKRTIIKGSGKGSVITASHAGNTTISGLTIKGGEAKQGGGIHIDHGKAAITDNVITGNKASWSGGGISIAFSDGTKITNNTIQNNTAGIDGGGIFQTDSIDVAVSNNHITDNKAIRDGGGYKNTSKVRPLPAGHDWAVVDHNVIKDNKAGRNGGGAVPTVSGFKLLANNFIDNIAGYGFDSITNKSASSNTITIDFKGCGGGAAVVTSSSSVAPGATWILGSASALAFGLGKQHAIRQTSAAMAGMSDFELSGQGSWTVNIADNHFTGNKAKTKGGALCIDRKIKPPVDKLDLSGNTFSGNVPDNVVNVDLNQLTGAKLAKLSTGYAKSDHLQTGGKKKIANGYGKVKPKKKQMVTGGRRTGEQPLGKLVLPGESMGKFDVPPGALKTTKGNPLDDIKPRYDYVEQETGTCNSAIGGIADSFFLPMPKSEKTANKAASAIGNFAKGALGGMLGGGGMFGGLGGSGGQSGTRLVKKPKGPWYKSSTGNTAVEIGGWAYRPRSKKKKPEIRIAQRIKDSPDKGGPHMMILQNRDGQILRPTGYMIFEVWRYWKLTITITRDTWVNGAHTSHSVSRESTQWSELAERYRKVMEAPGIWEQFGVAPFGKIRGVIAQFPLPEHFNPAEWTLVKHDTSKATVNGKEMIKTVPFVVSVGQGKKDRLTFRAAPGGKTVYQSSHGCRTTEEVLNAALGMLVPDYLKGKAQKPPSQYKLKKARLDAFHWARIMILQPSLSQRWHKDYLAMARKLQMDTAAAMADIVLRIVTGNGVWDAAKWEKDYKSMFGRSVRNAVIIAANNWKRGMSEQQIREMAGVYSKLSPALQRVFQREFIYTLASNLFLDLRLPTPVVY